MGKSIGRATDDITGEEFAKAINVWILCKLRVACQLQ